ncbi:MAG: GGDEF domain-containing protein [Cycloclasticus sp.]|nr:GGDEF domain-containing protein [Cycloclasticus sp.]
MMQQKSHAISEMAQVMQARSITLLKMLNEHDAFVLDDLHQDLFQYAASFNQHLDDLRNTDLTQQQSTTLDELLRLAILNANIQMEVANQLIDEKKASATKTLFDVAIPNQIPMNALIRDFVVSVEKESAAILAELQNKLDQNQPTSIFLTTLFGLSAVLFLYFLLSSFKQGEHMLAQRKIANDKIIDSASDAIIMVNDEGLITLYNRAAIKLFGYTSSEVTNKPIDLLIPIDFEQFVSPLIETHGSHHEYYARHKNKQLIPIQIAITDTGINGSNRYSLIIRDISLNKENERQIVKKSLEVESARVKYKQLSETDALTLIANRRAYDHRLADEINTAKRSGQPLALLLFDIDMFKQYNDHYGHNLGDLTLKKVATTIAETLPRSTDFVARFGGEEFVVLLPTTNVVGAYEVAERIRLKVNSLAIAHATSSIESNVTISVGLTAMSSDKLDGTELFKQADEALYVAKATGKNRTKVFKSSNSSGHLKSV